MTTITDSPPRRAVGTRLRLAAPLAAAWLGGWGLLALLSALTGTGYPFGANDPHGGATSVLRLVPVRLGAPLFAGVLLLAAVAALLMSRTDRVRGLPRALLLGYGWTVAFGLAVVVPDARVLIILGYLPMLIIGAPFGWPPVDYADIFDWPLLARCGALLGGLLLAGAVLVWQRRTVGACAACGRGDDERGWTSPAAAARWGRWAAYAAAAIPLCYAVTRLAWAAGIPLGISGDFLRELRESGAVWAGAGLGAFATVGAILTLGLVRPWGERFPRWMVGLAGRRVPITLAVVPATLVALSVTAATLGLMSSPAFWQMGEVSLATAPMLLWPLWGPALGAATVAYHLRRRGACARCRRPWPGPVPRGR
ncbi:hypothetical protein ONA91_09795 [Micromonospora sp. DR5-3]|uniref:hypothetical protein n=1 Tax=unclassified Micromonospora TaxID=2617518 RepID=UPI0011D45FE3|nr:MULTISPECIES: hypothetical protein [unclassified Micromonospora]MCW3814746.1 hypothetical protein [Micromonospora sp. DR5-3]TYC23532.1 hypothetical protein FXF52_15240 [Micromonospora sp. MP36]